MFRLIGLIFKIVFVLIVLGFVHKYIAERWDLGSLGFRPVQNNCFGILMKSGEVYESYETLSFLPKGQVKTKYFSLEYNVPRNKLEAGKGFCLGQDKKK
ncbi:hypothetical protein HN784_03195 [bacterium]|jgi:hypothetical protein|nr:hypothetical protein [bacterium]MBT4251300.1 hypothetical protein [bacterium]MBT4598319.1 hypothetical protein [bacterium]MBT6754152.1 hypothetical protein [bacterium]MBT7037972.1 hypothetical protein [bacterium]